MRGLTLLLVFLTAASYAVAKINRLSADLLANARAHHTDKYELADQKLIVRRGGDIVLSVESQKEAKTLLAEVKMYDEVVDRFEVGNNRRDIDKKINWTSTIDQIDENHDADKFKVNFRLHVPIRSMVGKFEISIHEEGEEGRVAIQQAYILFNPWNKGEGRILQLAREHTSY